MTVLKTFYQTKYFTSTWASISGEPLLRLLLLRPRDEELFLPKMF